MAECSLWTASVQQFILIRRVLYPHFPSPSSVKSEGILHFIVLQRYHIFYKWKVCGHPMLSDGGQHLLALKCFLIRAYTLFIVAIMPLKLNRQQYSVICYILYSPGDQKKSVWLTLLFHLFYVVVSNQMWNTSELCM